MSTYTVYIDSAETTTYVVEAATPEDARKAALRRWDDGEQSDIPINSTITYVTVDAKGEPNER